MTKVKFNLEQEISLTAGIHHLREKNILVNESEDGVEAQKSDKVTKHLKLKLGDLKYES